MPATVRAMTHSTTRTLGNLLPGENPRQHSPSFPHSHRHRRTRCQLCEPIVGEEAEVAHPAGRWHRERQHRVPHKRSIHGVTPNPLLVLSRVNRSFAYSRNSYVPGARELGMENAHEPAPAAALGVCEQLTYVHARYAVSAAPGANRPIQSLGVGDGTPAHWAETEAPAATMVGLAERVRAPPTVNVLLVARRVKPSFANNRNS